MGIRRFGSTRLVYGRDGERSRYWTKIAVVLLVISPAIMGTWWAAADVGVVSPGDLASGLVSVVVVALLVSGPIAATIQAYRNDGVLVSIALAVAPVVGLALFVGDALYVTILLGAYALVAGVVGFAVGAGARRMAGRRA